MDLCYKRNESLVNLFDIYLRSIFCFYVKFSIFALTIYVTAIRTYYFKSYQLFVSFQPVVPTIFRLEMTKGFY